MSKLPIVSGRQASRVFTMIGYKVVRQKGSHMRLRDDANPSHLPLTVPDHKVVRLGLLRDLLRNADISVEEFTRLLKES